MSAAWAGATREVIRLCTPSDPRATSPPRQPEELGNSMIQKGYKERVFLDESV